MPKQIKQTLTIELYKLVPNHYEGDLPLSEKEIDSLKENLELVVAEIITDKNIVIEVV